MNGITTGMAFLAGLGLAEILLCVLTFAIVFAVLTKLKIFSRAPATLISIVAGIFVLMAVPTALISVIAGMSTSLVAVAIGILALIALLEVAGIRHGAGFTKEGKKVEGLRTFEAHPTAISIILIVIALTVFYAVGGFAILGITIPSIGPTTLFLIIIGIAILGMLSEAGKPGA